MTIPSRDISFRLNDTAVTVNAPPSERLTAALRDRLGATGTKVGCDAGDCGACTVLIDGQPVCACMQAVGQIHGRSVTTVEGLGRGNGLDRLQQSFLRHGAAQCGICTPGMLVSAAALLRANPKPDEQAVLDGLGGVLCRCTGYRKIVQAVLDAANGGATEAAAAEAGLINVGHRLERLDGGPKVRGVDPFGADAAPDDALVLRVVRSPHHHTAFELGNVDEFVADHPGLIAAFTAADVPGENCYGVIPEFADQVVFAADVCRYRGEAVAAVVGTAAAMVAFDPDLFPVTWQPLPAMLTPTAAQASDAVRLHEHRADNLLTGGLVQRGDVGTELEASAHVAAGHYETGYVEHAYIEPEAGFARRVGERIEVHACTQAPYMDRDAVAGILGIAPDRVRIVPTAIGGGFGSKLDVSVQPFLAIAAWRLDQPVKMTYSRPESMMSTTKRHPSEIDVRVGADQAGKLTAIDFFGCFNTGAYASWGPTVANRVPVHASGPYAVPHYRALTRAIHTNGPPAGAFRGFGVPQATIAVETQFDELADMLGMDRLDFRLNNVLQDGEPTVTGQVFETGVGIEACLRALEGPWRQAMAAAAAFNANATGDLRRGIGIASAWYGCGNTSMSNPSTIKIGLGADGMVVLHQGAVDVGQGSNTVIAQIAAESSGIALDRFRLVGADTDVTPDAGKTSASRQTFISGNAALRAGAALRAWLLGHANVGEAADIVMSDGEATLSDEDGQHRIDLTSLALDGNGYVVTVEESYDPPTKPLDENGQGDPYAVFGYAAHMVELEVDQALGTVKLLKIVAAHDVGQAINPTLVEGQVEGGIAQGIGMALMEEFLPGRTENLHDYLIPTIGDVPEIETKIVEVRDPHGPYGAKGLGEHVLIATAPAILNAIRDATGARLRRLPATPHRVRAAIVDAQGGRDER